MTWFDHEFKMMSVNPSWKGIETEEITTIVKTHWLFRLKTSSKMISKLFWHDFSMNWNMIPGFWLETHDRKMIKEWLKDACLK